MSIEIPKEIWNDPSRLYTLFKHINNRLMELLKIEREKEKIRKKIERETKKNNKKQVFYGTSKINLGTVELPES